MARTQTDPNIPLSSHHGIHSTWTRGDSDCNIQNGEQSYLYQWQHQMCHLQRRDSGRPSHALVIVLTFALFQPLINRSHSISGRRALCRFFICSMSTLEYCLPCVSRSNLLGSISGTDINVNDIPIAVFPHLRPTDHEGTAY